ncbi:MAG: MoxR family ATPase [Bacillaceae bacterium]|nr:MoxR family ATPase [Bacillaceae bacterium]
MDPKGKLTEAKQEIQKVIMGQDDVIDMLFTALLAKGHVLLESVPGSGKTMLAKSFARVMEGTFNRIQFTPDVLPSDVTGIQFFNPKTQEFEWRIGPVQTNVLLADEINRATPKTQSSLLEVMEERQTTIDGKTIDIDPPFFVIATQNPIETNHGTFPLPEAQLDRFLFKLQMNYPKREAEKAILTTYRLQEPLKEVTPVLALEDILNLQQKVREVTVSDTVTDYLLSLVEATRNHPDIELGISTRGALALMRASQARALIKGRSYVNPADVKELAPFIFAHRLILTMESSIQRSMEGIIENVIGQVEVPVEAGEVES